MMMRSALTRPSSSSKLLLRRVSNLQSSVSKTAAVRNWSSLKQLPSSSSVGSSFTTAHDNPQRQLQLLLPPPSPGQPQRHFSSSDSSGSHDDFAPQKKEMDDDNVDQALKLIQQHVSDNPVMLYMKGHPAQPQCGFSQTVVSILKAQDVDFASVNVLDYPAIREGVKKFSQWPTIPQLYVKGEFIGGCDIVTEMHQSGELATLLKAADSKAAKETK